MINGLTLTPLKVIDVPGGNVMHGIKRSAPGFVDFGEAYFSQTEYGAVKGWKRHNQMTLNVVVPLGAIRFVIYDDRADSKTQGQFEDITLSLDNYQRLTIAPGLWVAFQGVDKNTSMLLNVADIEHVPDEADRLELNEIQYDWEIR